MEVNEYRDTCSGYKVVVERTPRGHLSNYFMTLYCLATGELIETGACFNNKNDMWEYYKEEFRQW